MTKKSSDTKKHPLKSAFVSESCLRVSFLEQAAKILIQQSKTVFDKKFLLEHQFIMHLGKKNNDTLNALSKKYLKEQREICYGEQLRMHRNFKRSLCKKCHRIWIPNAAGNSALKIEKGRKKIKRTCTDCNTTKAFALNFKYLSRNEKFNCLV